MFVNPRPNTPAPSGPQTNAPPRGQYMGARGPTLNFGPPSSPRQYTPNPFMGATPAGGPVASPSPAPSPPVGVAPPPSIRPTPVTQPGRIPQQALIAALRNRSK